MFGSYFGHILDKPLSSLAGKIQMSPNTITITGLVVTIMAAIILANNLFWGGILILLAGLFDMLDGIVARTHDKATKFGAFFDSVLDRYSDSFLFLGLAWYFMQGDAVAGAVLSLGTMVGALLVSYTRARAEGLGTDCKVGVMERPERVVLMAFGALTGWIVPVIWIMFILTHITVVQRIHHVWKVMEEERDPGA
jgi:phosphatidylglycerophosphate synthase